MALRGGLAFWRGQGGLDGGAEFSGGVAGDRDAYFQFAGAVVVAQFEMEGIEQAA